MDFPDAPTLAAELQAAHFTWIAFHVDDVGTLEWTSRVDPGHARSDGIEVGGWGYEDSDP